MGLSVLARSHSIWLDIVGLTIAVTLLEAAFYGRGRTVAHGRASYWQVAPWLRPVLGVVGRAFPTQEGQEFHRDVRRFSAAAAGLLAAFVVALALNWAGARLTEQEVHAVAKS